MSQTESVRRFFLLAFVALFLASYSRAQITNVTNVTSTPTPGTGHDYIHMLQETVNPANGSVSLRIQVPVPPGREITIPFAFAYDSNGVHHLAPVGSSLAWFSNYGFLSKGGWAYAMPVMSADTAQYTYSPDSGETNYTCDFLTDYMFQGPSGGRHPLYLASTVDSYQQCNSIPFQPTQSFSGGDDIFGATLTTNGIFPLPLTVVDADGTTYSFPTQNQTESPNPSSSSFYGLPSQIEDRNGNKVLITDNHNGAFTVQDSAGRTSVSSSGFGATGNTITISGFSNPYTLTWGTANTNFLPSSHMVSAPYAPCPPSADTETQAVVTAITLPNGKQYQFFYDSTYGVLNKVVYPTGGYVSYTWGLNSLSEGATFVLSDSHGNYPCNLTYDSYVVTHRYVSFDGSTIALQQDFTYSTVFPSGSINWTTKQTTVTTKDCTRASSCDTAPSFQTVYNYTPINAIPQPNDSNLDGVGIPVERTIVYQDTNGSTLRTVTKNWIDQNLLACSFETLDNGVVSGKFFTYGPGAQITDEKDYDYGQLAATSCSSSTTAPASPTPARETATSYQYFSGSSILDKPASVIVYGSGTRVAESDYTYDQATVGSVSNLPLNTHDETNYAPNSTTPRGNATKVTRKCLQSCSDSITSYTYDETGQVLSSTDPCGNAACSDMTGANHTTFYSYTDSYSSCLGAAPPSGNTNAYVTQITDPIGHAVNFCYGYNDGQLRGSTDPNGLTTTYKYNDSLARLTETDFPDSGQSTIVYNDTALTVSSSKKINSTQTVTTVSVLDGVGQVKQTQLTSDPQGTVYSDTTFDGFGRVWKQSNPYRSGSDPTSSSGTTLFAYDAIGRKLSETYPDGSVQTTAYCGPSTLVTDPTSRWRRSRADGLGHLVEVDEPNAVGATVAATGCPGTGEPVWVTSYSYDALNNLLQVIQNGSHQRTFTYDSLSRMLTSTNPEVGALTYTYDANANVSTKQDARAITTTYGYDVINRLLAVSYSNGDPGSTFTYDQQNCLGLPSCQNVGQRTSATDSAGSEAWSYQVDAPNLRSVHVNQRTTISSPSNITKTSTYYLDLAGNITQFVYPTGRAVNYTYDSANRPKVASDGSNGITYATGFQTVPTGCIAGAVCYTPQGTFYGLSIGQTSTFSGLNLTHTFNNRLQPLEFKASSSGGNAIDITYSFADPLNGNHNAGHAFGITNNLDSTRSQVFTYDQLNRITSAQTTSTFATSPAHCWGENFGVDPWGNLQSITATTNTAYNGCAQESGFTKTADANNHISGFSYDSSGNTLNDGVNSYTWNAESQMKTAAGVAYLYDGAGRRVSKSNGKLYWYGSGGEILSETDASGNATAEYIFFGGKRVAMLTQGSPGTGSATISGSEQSMSGAAATSGAGSVTFSGTLQSKQVQSQPATPGTGSATISGSEKSSTVPGSQSSGRYSISFYPAQFQHSGQITLYVNGAFLASANFSAGEPGYPIAQALSNSINGNSSAPVTATWTNNGGGPGTVTVASKSVGSNTNWPLSITCSASGASCSSYVSASNMTGGTNPVTTYDIGSVWITVNGTQYSTSYGQNDNSSSVATRIATAISAGSWANASASGSTISVTAKTSGAGTNYSLSAGASGSFSPPSFSASVSGSFLTGGANATYTTVYDSGTSAITVNGHANVVSWSGPATTASSIASALASNINGDSGAFVSASASGSTVNLAAKTTGVNTNYSLSSSSTFDTSNFSSASFTSSNSSSTLTGGHDAGATIYDSGSVWITINGTQYSVSYGQGSSSASVASALASAISADSLANASASGSSISITAKTSGGATNYSLSSGSSTSQGSFSSASFTASTSGSTLTGGQDGIFYYLEDMLGTSRVLAYASGIVCYDADFYPYGGERTVTNTCAQNAYKFEGKERDSETGNDDFGARYYSNRFGRWLSSDWSSVPVPVPYANLTNPQTLNLYAMVSDDPETFADLDGHCCDGDGPGDMLGRFIVNTVVTWASDNAFGFGRPKDDSVEGKLGQALGDTIAQYQGMTEAEAGTAGLADSGLMAVVPGGQEVALGDALVSGAAVLHGGTTATIANSHLAKAAAETASNIKGPVKAKDAPGVTAGGQATDKDGNKLGPSGDKQINRTRSNTREAAKNRARNEGSGVEEHRNPQKGSQNPHFHPTNKKGKKKPSSTHHEYPN